MARVMITGMGLLTPLGSDPERVFSRLLAGHSGIGPIRGFDASACKTRIAGELLDFDPTAFMASREAKRLDRCVQFALGAAQMAVRNAALDIPVADPYRVGVVVGSGAGGLGSIEEGHRLMLEKGPGRVPPLSIPRMMINASPSLIAHRFGFRGPNFSVALACASGAASLAQAGELIRAGRADVMIAGGIEASVTPLGVSAFGACGSLSTRNDDPQRACRPFDRGRDGMVMSEGAGILVLESEAHARARGATIYAELAGWGLTSDIFHITAPDPEGVSAARAIELALEDAGARPDQVGYINAHGTATPLNDVMEVRAIRRALGGAATRVCVSSSKSMLGHMLGAAGAVEAAITVLALQSGQMPPTLNVDDQDPQCNLDVIPNVSRDRPDLRLALSHSFAFGGQNVVLALSRVDPD